MEKIEYIDKEELLGSLERKIKADNERGMAVVDSDFIALVNDATVIEDVIEVVRCKDCRHFFHCGRTSVIIGGENVVAGWCQRRVRSDEEFRMTPNDFCSYGEPKPASE